MNETKTEKRETDPRAGMARSLAPLLPRGERPPDARDADGRRVAIGDVVQVIPRHRTECAEGDDSWKVAGILAVVSALDRLPDASYRATCYWTVPAMDEAGPRRGYWYSRCADLAVVGRVPYPVTAELGTCGRCGRMYAASGGRKCGVCGQTFCGVGDCHVHLMHKEKKA